MSVLASAPAQSVPRNILQPLFWGAACVFAFLVAVVGWAAFAPLATTVHMTGHLTADTPSFDLQHPHGGALAEVLVREHEYVTEGQLLARLDVKQQRKEFELLGDLLTLRQSELQIIEHILGQDLEQPLDPGHYTGLKLFQRLNFSHRSILLDREAMLADDIALQSRISDLSQGAEALRGRHASMRARYDRYRQLVAEGRMRGRDHDLLHEQILELENDIATEDASLSALRAERERRRVDIRRGLVEFRRQLLSDHIRITLLLPELKTRFTQLNAQLEQADVRAPATGVVSSLHYNKKHMYLPTGRSFLTLTEPPSEFQVEFQVPPSAIDQLQIGMSGYVSFTSLAQRNLPRVQLEIKSLAPIATRSSEGEVVSYRGKASIDPDDFEALQAQLADELFLSIDMPVSLSFTGRQTTFANYVIGPFFTFLSRAWQD